MNTYSNYFKMSKKTCKIQSLFLIFELSIKKKKFRNIKLYFNRNT